MKIDGCSVAGWIAIDTPPTSHRSQIANNGSMPISACSAAWTAPSTSGGATPAAMSTSGESVYQTAWVVSERGGTSRGTISIDSFVEDCLRWYATTWFVTSTVPT